MATIASERGELMRKNGLRRRPGAKILLQALRIAAKLLVTCR
jgi:hypothetical protein